MIGNALRSKLVDKMYIYMAPIIIGDEEALDSVTGLRVFNVRKALRLKKIQRKAIGEDLLIEGYLS